jgi:hypothetical protein
MKKHCFNRRNKEFSIKQTKYILNELKLLRNDLCEFKSMFDDYVNESYEADVIKLKPKFQTIDNVIFELDSKYNISAINE